MHLINLQSCDPFFNLAIEEYLLKNSNEEYLILCVNGPSVIIGKHQSGHMEVNTKFVNENKISVIRRITGGGTVFHDNGNLNFSFIRQSESGKQVDFRKYTKPVIDFLSYSGVEAKFEGKSDLKIDGLKISGNAEHIYRNRVLHHGTLLFSTSLEMLRSCIRKDKSCYNSRAVGSNPASVMNLNEKMSCCKDINEFRSEIMNYFLRNLSETFPYELTPDETLQARALADSKYKTWEWNWAYGPDYQFRNSFEIDKIHHSCTLQVKEGVICACSLEGSDRFAEIGAKLIGCRHMVDDMSEFFSKENILLTKEEIYNFF